MVARLYQYRFPQREGLILEYNDGWGEIAPLPNFSQETLSEAKAEILSLLPSLSSAKPTLPSVQFGINCAKTSFSLKPLKVPLCAFLLPEKECQFLKLKVGHLGLNEAISLVNQYKKNYRLRIDCNQKWSLNKALCFSRYFKPTDFDYIEEPVSSFLDLIHFSEQTGFPVAIDEKGKIPFSLEKIPTLKAVVTKPMIIGGVPKRAFPTVLSSTYETSLGHLLIARLATEKMPPIGLGTFSYTTDSILQPPLRSEGGFLCWEPLGPPIHLEGLCLIASAP